MRTTSNFTRRSAAVALAGALAFGAAACGDDTDDDAGSSEDASEPAGSEMMSEPAGSEMMSEPAGSES